MTKRIDYKFPVSTLMSAYNVTGPDFKIDFVRHPKLLVDFDQARSDRYKKTLYKTLGARLTEDGKLLKAPDEDFGGYRKIIFSGHKGSGKSTELFRAHQELSEIHKSIFIDMDMTLPADTLQYMDLLLLIMMELGAEETGLGKGDKLDELMGSIFNEKTILEEVGKEFEMEINASQSLGWDVFFAKLKAGFLQKISAKSKTLETLRRKIEADPYKIVDGLNEYLREQSELMGKDILIILDGNERSRQGFFESIFVENPQLIRNLEAHCVFSVSIKRFYEIQNTGALSDFKNILLPMLSPSNPDSHKLLMYALSKRCKIDTLFEPGTVEYLCNYAGGNIQQFFRLASDCLLDEDGEKVTMENVKSVIKQKSVQLKRTLTSEHQEVLSEGKYDSANGPVLDLLFSLALLEDNGTRRVNPLLESEFSPKTERGH